MRETQDPSAGLQPHDRVLGALRLKAQSQAAKSAPVDPALSCDSPFHHEVSALPRLKGAVPSKERGSGENTI